MKLILLKNYCVAVLTCRNTCVARPSVCLVQAWNSIDLIETHGINTIYMNISSQA